MEKEKLHVCDRFRGLFSRSRFALLTFAMKMNMRLAAAIFQPSQVNAEIVLTCPVRRSEEALGGFACWGRGQSYNNLKANKASVPVLTFVSGCCECFYECQNQRNAGKYNLTGAVLNLTFAFLDSRRY
jgi:hypothetical protein